MPRLAVLVGGATFFALGLLSAPTVVTASDALEEERRFQSILKEASDEIGIDPDEFFQQEMFLASHQDDVANAGEGGETADRRRKRVGIFDTTADSSSTASAAMERILGGRRSESKSKKNIFKRESSKSKDKKESSKSKDKKESSKSRDKNDKKESKSKSSSSKSKNKKKSSSQSNSNKKKKSSSSSTDDKSKKDKKKSDSSDDDDSKSKRKTKKSSGTSTSKSKSKSKSDSDSSKSKSKKKDSSSKDSKVRYKRLREDWFINLLIFAV